MKHFSPNLNKPGLCINCGMPQRIHKEDGECPIQISYAPEDTIKLEVDPITAMCIIGNIQLATRHTENVGASRKIAEAFARKLQAEVVKYMPDQAALIEMGWNQTFDIHDS